MDRTLTVATVAMVVCLMFGCSKPPEPSNAGAAQASLSAAPAGSVEISASELPHLKAGEWEMVDADHRVQDQSCVPDRPFSVGKMAAFCQKFVFHRTPTGGVTVNSECGRAGVTSKMHMSAEGDFKSAYSTDMQMSISLLPGQPPRLSETHLQFRYVGPCTPSDRADADAANRGE